MVNLRDRADQDLAQGIAAVIREAFAAVDSDDLTAQARYDSDLGGWTVRHWHRGVRYDLGMCEVGQVPGLWRNDAWMGGMGSLTIDDTYQSVAIRMLLIVHGDIQITPAMHAATRQIPDELHANLTSTNCTCPRAACGGALVSQSEGRCPEHDVDHAGVWHWDTSCPGVASDGESTTG